MKDQNNIFRNIACFALIVFAFSSCGNNAKKENSISVENKVYTRAYLKTMVENYLDAMVANDPSAIPLSDTVKFTENTSEINIGEGLWVGASKAPSNFKIVAIDTVSSQVGFFGIMEERDAPVIVAVRLKVAHDKITEVEQVVSRRIGDMSKKKFDAPRAAFLAPVPKDQRNSRAELLAIADSYFDALEQDDSSVAPFADDCVRHENGSQTTTNARPNPDDFGDTLEEQFRLDMAYVDACGCAKQIDIQSLSYISKIQPRRLHIIDEELGLVFGFPMFVHLSDIQEIKIEGLPEVDSIPKPFPPFNLPAGEIFKISGGQLHEIEANGVMAPYGIKSGWD